MLRFLIIRNNCKACLELVRIVPRINLRLPIDKRIKIINNFEWEKFKLKRNLIQERFTNEEFPDYPLLYLDGILIQGSLWAEQMQHYLDTFLQKDFIIQ